MRMLKTTWVIWHPCVSCGKQEPHDNLRRLDLGEMVEESDRRDYRRREKGGNRGTNGGRRVGIVCKSITCLVLLAEQTLHDIKLPPLLM